MNLFLICLMATADLCSIMHRQKLNDLASLFKVINLTTYHYLMSLFANYFFKNFHEMMGLLSLLDHLSGKIATLSQGFFKHLKLLIFIDLCFYRHSIPFDKYLTNDYVNLQKLYYLSPVSRYCPFQNHGAFVQKNYFHYFGFLSSNKNNLNLKYFYSEL